MGIELKVGCFEDAAAVRRAVFMDEQGYEAIAPVDVEDEGQPHRWMARVL